MKTKELNGEELICIVDGKEKVGMSSYGIYVACKMNDILTRSLIEAEVLGDEVK